MEMKALSLKYSNPVLSQIQGCAIFLRYWVKLLKLVLTVKVSQAREGIKKNTSQGDLNILPDNKES